MKRQAFTLVELIVVITILAILGTIGFISLQGFSSDARDSKRISEVSEIRNGLQIYQARNSLVPTPSEQTVTIGSGTTDLIIQGYAGTSVLNEIKMNGDSKDPLEKEYYTYSVNASKTKFELLSLLENDNNLTSFNNLNIIPTTHASYLNRYPYTVGGGAVGILLDEATNTPLQKLATSVDLSTDTNNYKVVFSDNNEVSTLSGELLYTEIVVQTNNNGTSQTQEPIPTVGQNISTVGGETALYAGVYEGRTIWVAGTENYSLQWKTSDTSTSNASNATDGRQNTGTFNTDHPASNYCQNLNWAGYTDWYLPASHNSSAGAIENCGSKPGELQFLYCQHRGEGSQSLLGFDNYYWSSTENDISDARYMNFVFGSWLGLSKGVSNRVRCVRVAD